MYFEHFAERSSWREVHRKARAWWSRKEPNSDLWGERCAFRKQIDQNLVHSVGERSKGPAWRIPPFCGSPRSLLVSLCEASCRQGWCTGTRVCSLGRVETFDQRELSSAVCSTSPPCYRFLPRSATTMWQRTKSLVSFERFWLRSCVSKWPMFTQLSES